MHGLTVDRSDGVPVVVARGELDAYAESDLAATFSGLAAEERLVVDLEPVAFLDSTALGAIVRSLREIDERGGRAAVVLPSGPARRIFEITTLDRVLPVSESREQAVRALMQKA
jgi:anti-sigma B factor antagonist